MEDAEIITKTKRTRRSTHKRYDFWITDEGLDLIHSWARKDLTNEEIIHNIGAYDGEPINQDTFYEWLKRFPEISEAIKNGRYRATKMVENALYKNAEKGNLGAQVFILKNRDSVHWKDIVTNNVDTTAIDKLQAILNGVKANAEADAPAEEEQPKDDA